MTTQPTVKARSALDWLCWTLIVFGALCLAASVPNTFTMVRVAHDDFGSAILVVVLEVMAFFALLAPLWVPAWAKTFDRIAYVLLGITTLGNYAGGWNYVWTHSEMGPFWMSIRDWREPIFGLPLATILLVGVLSGLVPFAMKFFISLAIKRYRENELDTSPEAVAKRAIEPFVVQVVATRMMQEQILGLSSQFHEPLVLPNLQPTVNARAALTDLGIDVDAEMARILAEREAQRQEGEQRHPFEADGLTEADQREVLQAVRKASVREAGRLVVAEDAVALETLRQAETPAQAVTEASDKDRELTPAEVKAKLAAEGWESLSWGELGKLPASPEKEAEKDRRKSKLKAVGRRFLYDAGLLPAKPVRGVYDAPEGDLQEQVRQWAARSQASTKALEAPAAVEAVTVVEEPAQAVTIAPVALAKEPTSASGGAVATWECSGCGAEGSNGAKGKARSWSKARDLGDKLYCKDCRDSGNYGK